MSQPSRQSGVEIRHLRLIVALAEHGSLTSVARLLGLTQPALSHQLRDVEVRLGAPLFERTARRMVLTPVGEQLAHVARRVLAEVDAFERQVVDGEFSAARGRVRVATECYTAYHWLPSVLREFQNRWPKVELRVAPEHTASPIAALRQGSLDLGIVYHRSADKRIRFEPLFEDEMVVVTAPGHRFAGADYVPVEALGEEHLFHYPSLASGSSAVRDILESADVQPSKTTQLQLTEAILELVAAGFGVAILAKWAVAPAVRVGTIHTARLGKNGYKRTWYAAVRGGDVTPAYQFDLIEMLRRHLSDGPTARVGQQLRRS
jgi:LysR family transcriptional regulator, regulator for metE and metH